MRNAGDVAVAGEPPAELAPRSATSSSGWWSSPAVVAEATERRGPHVLTTYAIRVADDFHRFYHHHRVLESGEP